MKSQIIQRQLPLDDLSGRVESVKMVKYDSAVGRRRRLVSFLLLLIPRSGSETTYTGTRTLTGALAVARTLARRWLASTNC